MWCSAADWKRLQDGARDRGESLAGMLLRLSLAEVGGSGGDNYDDMLKGEGEVAEALRWLVAERRREREGSTT